MQGQSDDSLGEYAKPEDGKVGCLLEVLRLTKFFSGNTRFRSLQMPMTLPALSASP